jgi:hypothetical protein
LDERGVVVTFYGVYPSGARIGVTVRLHVGADAGAEIGIVSEKTQHGRAMRDIEGFDVRPSAGSRASDDIGDTVAGHVVGRNCHAPSEARSISEKAVQ